MTPTRLFLYQNILEKKFIPGSLEYYWKTKTFKLIAIFW